MHARIACAWASRKCPPPLHTSLRTSPTNSTPQKAYLLSKKSWEEKTLKTNFFICTEHFLRPFWTNSKHLNLFFRIWLMLENIVSRWKYGQTWLIWTCLQTSLEKNAPPFQPPRAYVYTHVCTHARSGLRWTCLMRTFWARWPVNLWLVGFPVCTCLDTELRWFLWLQRCPCKGKEQSWIFNFC